MLLLGLFTSNYAILFFLIGFLFAAPLATWVINRILPIIWNAGWYIAYYISLMFGKGIQQPGEWLEMSYFKTQVGDVCKLVIPYLATNDGAEVVISSEWMAMVSFFIGYVICNALQLYNIDMSNSASINSANAADTEMKVKKRKGQAMVALISIILFALIVLYFRMNAGCERAIGILLTAAGFGTAGYYWYDLLSMVGQGRLSDIFGIANRLLAPSAIKNGPIACVPIPSS
jgi:hypothetical protein